MKRLMLVVLLTGAWTAPDPDTLPDDAFGRTVRAGRDIIAHTAASIGPGTAASASGNGLECQNCHLDAGTRLNALPLAGTWGVFPQFIGRENDVRTLEDRINGCLERSMNGRALPADSAPMKAMLAYIRFISAGIPTGQPIEGRATPALMLPATASDPLKGAAIFQQTCAPCHQPDGQGLRLPAAQAAEQRHPYLFPPLWGERSYNDGAGMARPVTAAAFIRANMPVGTDAAHPVLSAQDAFDVAVFIDSQPRPHRAGNELDYPNRALKPADATYPPFLGPFPPSQHLTGPWQPIQQWQREHAATLTGPPQ